MPPPHTLLSGTQRRGTAKSSKTSPAKSTARRSPSIMKRCKMCKKEFSVPDYYLRLHGDRKFCSNECFKKFRVLKGFLDAAAKNEKNRAYIRINNLI